MIVDNVRIVVDNHNLNCNFNLPEVAILSQSRNSTTKFSARGYRPDRTPPCEIVWKNATLVDARHGD